jgi:tRNA/tmRNA/rRNA uracil-C5-methylase (TrmA/RlmC/RlmD family)
VNTEAARVLMEVIRDLCLEGAGAAAHRATLLDICCGTGNIGMYLATVRSSGCGAPLT